MPQPTIFISYNHKDEAEKEELLAQLGVLQSDGLISLWNDDQIQAGADWEQEIKEAIAEARVAILLITANFLTSDFILGQEVPALLERRRNEGLTVFPVIAKPCAWKMVDWLTKMSVMPKNNRPVWSDGGCHADEDLAEIATEVAMIIKKAAKTPQAVITPGDEKQTLPAPGDEGLIIQELDDKDWDSLLYRIRAGKCTPFIGPEVIQNIVTPDSEIARIWAEEHAYPLDDFQNLPRVAQFLAIERDPAFPAEEVARYLEKIESPPNFKDPNEPHNFLASLPLALYITTNYDNFMTQALKKRSPNAKQELCRWNEDVEDIPSIFDAASGLSVSRDNPVVYHLFGHIGVHESMVLTEDDYLDFLINISKNQNIIPRQIEKALASTSLLFIGYRLRDLKFKILFRGLVTSQARRFRRTNVAVQLAPPPPEAKNIAPDGVRRYLKEYLDENDVRVYWGDSFEFIKELRQRWEDFNA